MASSLVQSRLRSRLLNLRICSPTRIKMNTASGIALPLEFRSIERSCIICMEDLKWPMFCPQCKAPTCYECLTVWFRVKSECPKCRNQYTLQPEERELYACPEDGKLVQAFCQKCMECICDKRCPRRTRQHGSHPIKCLATTRQSIAASLEKMEQLAQDGQSGAAEGKASEALKRIKLLLVKGTPAELVRASPKVLDEIAKFEKTVNSDPKKKFVCRYRLYNEPMFSKAVQMHYDSLDEGRTFLATDNYGNQWELLVYPNGFGEARNKFVSVYLKLIRGIAMRYEYRYEIYLRSNDKPLKSYYAVDDFSQGSQSSGCQRLIRKARETASQMQDGFYKINFSVRPTNMMYGLKCAEKLLACKGKQNQFSTFSYTVTKYSAVKIPDRSIFSNEMYDQQDITWRLLIVCNGHHDQESEFVSVFLELLNGAEGWFDFYIRLVHPLGTEAPIERQATHFFTVHSEWGVSQFISRARVREYLHNDELKLELGMRPALKEQEMMS